MTFPLNYSNTRIENGERIILKNCSINLTIPAPDLYCPPTHYSKLSTSQPYNFTTSNHPTIQPSNLHPSNHTTLQHPTIQPANFTTFKSSSGLINFALPMVEAIDNILSVSTGEAIQHSELELLQYRIQDIPGSVHYIICRYRKPEQIEIDEMGMLAYQYQPREEGIEKKLELVFCISGNKYCRKFDEECSFCRHSQSHYCEELVPTVDIAFFRFDEQHLGQFVKDVRTTSFSEDILNFRHESSFTKLLPLCGKSYDILKGLMNHPYTDSMANIFTNAQTQMLLLNAMECMAGDGPQCESFNCKFLANEEDRQKIALAREVLLQHICEPLTIRELSRKAAINECYLKKGFKEMYGCTIFDFFQTQRMEHAKYLLYEKGLTVTDVSNLLGYSSISHFSTAFKKHTGLKPCELLLR